ncbi:MAG: alpha/beta hydrolase, partial [Candidatus Obscuribacter sp.]|nr:alpha/beta hydrolase [Candidatus Obscuribacter sp.]
PMVPMLLQDKVSVFVYDYQGYGKSAGSATVDNIVDDGEAAYQWLRTDKHYKDKDIIVMGESLGTGVAGQLATRHPVGAIILQSGYTSLYKLAQQKMDLIKLYPPFLFLPQKLDTQAVLNRPHAPLLIIHGMRDRIIPFTQSEELYRTAMEPKQFAKLPDAGHNDIFDVDTDQYKKAISDFLTALPTASQSPSPSAALSTAQTQAPDGQP